MQLPEMLPLPEPDFYAAGPHPDVPIFTADQMRAYAKEYALLVLSSDSPLGVPASPSRSTLQPPAAASASIANAKD
jgi:hypothetical protein